MEHQEEQFTFPSEKSAKYRKFARPFSEEELVQIKKIEEKRDVRRKEEKKKKK